MLEDDATVTEQLTGWVTDSLMGPKEHVWCGSHLVSHHRATVGQIPEGLVLGKVSGGMQVDCIIHWTFHLEPYLHHYGRPGFDPFKLVPFHSDKVFAKMFITNLFFLWEVCLFTPSLPRSPLSHVTIWQSYLSPCKSHCTVTDWFLIDQPDINSS